MNVVQLLPILGRSSDGSGLGLKDGRAPDPEPELSADLRRNFGASLGLNRLASAISAELRVRCEVVPTALDPAPSFHSGRQQYHSTDLLARMQKHLTPSCWRVLGVTPLDLYIPILTFVFGEAQLEGGCALVSTYRLRQEFYGLPSDPDLLLQRLAKEAIHELGHTLGLTHCEDYECVMAPSHAVEWIDLKSSHACRECRRAIACC
ncbi:MAG: archaemetzincin family Zn-dependent metalloprotease [Terriglobia bacterium]